MARLFLLVACLAGCTTRNPNLLGPFADEDMASSTAPDLAPPPCNPARLADDPRHCGGCDNDCAALPNVDRARVACVGGRCALGGACLAGFGDCSTAPGCETDLRLPASCGTCGRACDATRPVCALGSDGKYGCSDRCPTTEPLLCSGSCVNPSSDVLHCGSCAPCPSVSGGAATCTNGKCGVACSTGFHLCSGQCATNTSVASCGSSCTPCPVPANATASCDGQKCDFTCNQGLMRQGDACVGPTCSPVCGSTQSCVDGSCCTGGGQTCTFNSDCCSGTCNTLLIIGLCSCASKGAACGSNKQCCSLECKAGSCTCAAVGEGCNATSDCCYGTCNILGICGCATVGNACGGNDDCCSGICTGGKCQCKQTGSCSSDDSCCSGQCNNGTCRDCIKNGESCGASPCCSGNCSSTTCACATQGAACVDKADCCDGYQCISGHCSYCSTYSQSCTSKPCCAGQNLTCSGGTTCCIPYGYSCTYSSECCSGRTCSGGYCQ